MLYYPSNRMSTFFGDCVNLSLFNLPRRREMARRVLAITLAPAAS